MKRIIKIILVIFIFFASFSIFNINSKAKGDLDRIDNYVVTVDPNFEDGSLNIKFDIAWTVLDSKSEGPLEWVKIGIPNYHALNIVPLTSNIKKIKYYSDDGSFIRVDFNKKYYQGETVNFSFKYNQSYMYHIHGDSIWYDYNPGYFNDIKVSKAVLKWNSLNVKSISNTVFNIVDGYYTYEASLGYSEYININLEYDKLAFTTIDPNKTYTDASEKYPWLLPTLFISAFVGIFALVYIVSKISRNPYDSERGFYSPVNGYYLWHRPFHRHYYNGGVSSKGKVINPPRSVSGGGFHGGGGGCACACACACAGGGRAGCSIKDFYHTNIRSEKLKKVLLKKHKSY